MHGLVVKKTLNRSQTSQRLPRFAARIAIFSFWHMWMSAAQTNVWDVYILEAFAKV